MKYKITDKQLDDVIFLYLDNQDFIQIKNRNKIYFVNSENDEYAQIKYVMDDGECMMEIKLIKEISSFFSLDNYDSRNFIKDWVENKLQMKVGRVDYAIHPKPLMLRIP
jgi:hypothetical protein